jgi:tRNA (guanine26-N2/guanine27-N2)-dimethyltransferase
MTFSEVKEGKVTVEAPLRKVVSKEMPVFYNPVMQLNRDLAVALLKSIDKKKMVIADPLAGTGIRTLRFLKELPASKIKTIKVNDGNPLFPKHFKKQLKKNKLTQKKVEITNKEASKFMLDSEGLDYIDIDPFGSPNPFLDAACKKISRHGILAVTVTDTGALAGSFPSACKRKYWAKPLRNDVMHETGARILIRKVQLIGMQYEKALIPIFTQATDHYTRIYFHVEKSKSYVDKINAKQGYFLWCKNCLSRASSQFNVSKCSCGKDYDYAGPLWLGELWNHKIVKQMIPEAEGRAKELLETIEKESHIPIVGFYDIHRIAKNLKATIPKYEVIFNALKKKKYKVALTHFSDHGIRTDAPLDEIKKILRKK